jgi:hypothetical protein
MPNFKLADDELLQIAKSLIEANHTHLLKAKITFVYQDKAPKTGDGKVILGKARKRTEIDKLLGREHEDFIIIIGKDKWDEANEEERRCLLDHELSHCGVVVSNKGNLKWIMLRHDLEEFVPILSRYAYLRDQLGDIVSNPPKDPTQKTVWLRRIRPKQQETIGNVKTWQELQK